MHSLIIYWSQLLCDFHYSTIFFCLFVFVCVKITKCVNFLSRSLILVSNVIVWLGHSVACSEFIFPFNSKWKIHTQIECGVFTSEHKCIYLHILAGSVWHRCANFQLKIEILKNIFIFLRGNCLFVRILFRARNCWHKCNFNVIFVLPRWSLCSHLSRSALFHTLSLDLYAWLWIVGAYAPFDKTG